MGWNPFEGGEKKESKKTAREDVREQPVPLENVVIAPDLVANPELDAVASKVEELGRYKVATYMDGGEVLKNKRDALEVEVSALMEQHKDALDAYLKPYFDLVQEIEAKTKSKPFPLSPEDSVRFHAAQSLHIERKNIPNLRDSLKGLE